MLGATAPSSRKSWLPAGNQARGFNPEKVTVRKLAWTTLIGGAIIEACRVFGIIAELNAYDFDLLLNPGTVLKYSYNYSFNISFVVIAGILFFLSICFRYGESLQQESDETL